MDILSLTTNQLSTCLKIGHLDRMFDMRIVIHVRNTLQSESTRQSTNTKGAHGPSNRSIRTRNSFVQRDTGEDEMGILDNTAPNHCLAREATQSNASLGNAQQNDGNQNLRGQHCHNA